MEPDSCPSADELLAFHRGDLSVADLDRIAAHLEGCSRCEAALQTLDAREGSLAAALRGQETPGPTAEMTVDSAVFRPSTPPGRGEGIGDVIGGRYKLVEAIGEGGMGAVFMAQQTEPVRRLVAIKLIKPGMDSRQVLARFEAERQAVALMDHPNIARVFDAGATDLGRPYFVMELVKGDTDHPLLRRESADPEGATGAVRPGLPGHPACPPEGGHPSRLEALEHPRRAARRPTGAEGDRLRRRQGDRRAAHRPDARDRLRRRRRHARIHGPRAGPS